MSAEDRATDENRMDELNDGILYDAEDTPDPAKYLRRRRILLGVAATTAVVALLALTPPYLNVNRLQRRIVASMSASLGRPVHLDNVTLHLLPVPGFTLQNLVVSEDPAFGDEPVIRANEVDITLRPSSLWRRQVELGTIRFVEPSLNLVRNAQGRWNVESLLMHAAALDAAPTAQRSAGPEPRFPYIEATDGRINVKIGEEKKPFSLTSTDFALWLPSATTWRLRMEGSPARTDENISDPGVLKLEGELQRAPTLGQVPINLKANWAGAPLGEASRLLTGEDAGWRGRLDLDTTITGTLSTAQLATKVQLDGLRRADFVPPRLLEVELHCSGTSNLAAAIVLQPSCSVQRQGLTVSASSLDLATLHPNETTITANALQESWLLDLARLFSQRIPAQESGSGVITGTITRVSAVPLASTATREGRKSATAPNPKPGWTGTLSGPIADFLAPPAPMATPAGSAGVAPTPPTFVLTGAGDALSLTPLSLVSTGGQSLVLSGTVSRSGYTLRLQGTVLQEDLQRLRNELPPLGDDLDAVIPGLSSSAAATPSAGSAGIANIGARLLQVDATCARSWRGPQTCTIASPPQQARKHHR
jgi:AsmA protein